jgi:cold shock CspA family protein
VWKVGKIISKFDLRGFAFARTANGEDFFLHVSEFVSEYEWDRASVGSKVSFQAGERDDPDKARPGENISLVL